MEVVAARVAMWVFTAFRFWLVPARVFSRLRVPYPAIVAAVLGWIPLASLPRGYFSPRLPELRFRHRDAE
jgi:hypothetical protein